jgi:cold shock CspA family protein
VLSGTVTEFSGDRGLGTVTTEDGQPYLFHVIEIADGSRTIEVGQSVTFQPLPKFGTLQAGSVRKV